MAKEKTQHGRVGNGVGSGAPTRGTSSARIESGETNEAPAQSPVEELEKVRQRLADLERGQKLGLVWREIPEDVETRLRDEIPVLIHEKELDVPGAIPSDQAHILIEGDNLHALHVLQATHRSRVDVIYIDPPYNTKNGEFIYNDTRIDEENTWRHSMWLSFMEKRLVLAQELMADGGVIFISIDDNEQARLRLLGDSVFGEKSFRGTFIWEKKRKASNLDGSIRGITEYVLCYSKGASRPIVHPSDEVEDAKPYPFYNSGNGRAELKFPANMKFVSMEDGTYEPAEFPDRKTIVQLLDKVVIRGGKNVGAFRLRGEWRYSQTTLDSLITNGEEIEFKGGKFKPYWINRDEDRVKKMKTLLTADTYAIGTNEDATDELEMLLGRTPFKYPKPVSLIEALVLAGSYGRKNAVVLDFFAGSGTTLHAVAQANRSDGGSRSCILITNNEKEVDICRDVTFPRCKAVLTGKWAGGKRDPLPGSLVFYRTEFAKRLKSPDRMRSEVAKHTVDLIAVKEGTARTLSRNTAMALLKGSGKTVAVIPGLNPDHADLRKTAERKVEEGDRKVVYLFTWSDNGVEEEIAALWPGWEVNPLPAEMLAALRRLVPPARLFDELGGAS